MAADLLRAPAASDFAAPPPIASAFFASASSRSSRVRSSTSAATRAGTSSGDALQRRRRLAQLARRGRSATAAPLRRSAPRSGGRPSETALSRDDLEQLDVAERADVGAAAQLDRIIARRSARPIESTRTSSPYFSPNSAIAPAEIASSGVISRVVTGSLRADLRRSPRPRPPRSPRGSAPWDARNRSGNSRARPGCPSG